MLGRKFELIPIEIGFFTNFYRDFGQFSGTLANTGTLAKVPVQGLCTGTLYKIREKSVIVQGLWPNF